MEEASVADATGVSPGLTGRDRVRAQSDAGTSYRTFPARLPVALTALGGSFVVLGSLGAAVRASAITSIHADPKTVRVLMGFSQAAGWVVAAFGVALVATSLAWMSRRRLFASVPLALIGVTAALVAGRLVSFNDRAAAWADAIRRHPSFLGFHAGLGWGAWCLLTGAVLAGFGALVGILREIDLRRGFGA